MTNLPLKVGLIAGGGILAAGAVGAGSWGMYSFFSDGDQPAEVLPSGTLAYASLDLDPGGTQKIEALRTLNKFPAFEDEVGIDEDADVRERFFTEVLEDADCDVSYADDIEPWLGTTPAIAAVDSGEEMPAPVFVVDVTDEDAAAEGMDKLLACDDGSGANAYDFTDGWMVLAENEDVVDTVVEAAGEETLADSASYQEWTDEAGDPGIATFYLGPDAGPWLAENHEMLGGMGQPMDPMGVDPISTSSTDELDPECRERLEDFRGGAGTVRFADGGIEVETAMDNALAAGMGLSAGAGDAVAELPEDTQAALSFAFPDGFVEQYLDELSICTGLDPDEIQGEIDSFTTATGLEVPEDLQTLLGDSLSLAVSGDLSAQGLMNSADPTQVPAGVRIHGDGEEIEAVLDKIRAATPMVAGFLNSEVEDDVVALSPDTGYVTELLQGGTLGESDAFDEAVPDADEAGFVLYFDANGTLVDELGSFAPSAAENLEPLQAVGVSAWSEDRVGHGKLRITTD